MWGQKMWGEKKTCGAKTDSKNCVPLENFAGSLVGLQNVWGEKKTCGAISVVFTSYQNQLY